MLIKVTSKLENNAQHDRNRFFLVRMSRWSTCTVPVLPSSSEMLVSVVTRCLRRFELASPSQPELSAFSLSTLEEQLEPQFAVGLGSPVTLAAADSGGRNSSLVDNTASIRILRPLSGDFSVHCENSWVATFMSTSACSWGFFFLCFSNLQSQTQLPVSSPSFDMEQYLPNNDHNKLVSSNSTSSWIESQIIHDCSRAAQKYWDLLVQSLPHVIDEALVA